MADEVIAVGDKVRWESKEPWREKSTIEHGVVEYIHDDIMSIVFNDLGGVSIGTRKIDGKWLVYRPLKDYLEELFKE